MAQNNSPRIQNHFDELTDPRSGRITYPPMNTIVIAICAVICGADGFVAIFQFGESWRDWLSKSSWGSCEPIVLST